MSPAGWDEARRVAIEGRLYPSVILYGGSVESRREAAVELGRIALCESDEAPPCGECKHCRRVAWAEPGAKGKGGVFHPDFMVLERDLKTVTSVEATKAFLRGAQMSPFEAGAQVFVVANAETLSGEAANALLKTLEEPPGTTPRHFLLLAPSRLDLLPTLRSRSLAVFLGSAGRPGRLQAGESGEVDDLGNLAADLRAAVDAWETTGNSAELFAAAAVLKQAGKFTDAGASEPWERAAEIALRAADTAEGLPGRRRLLALAQDLLDSPPLRARGVSPDRLLEGYLNRRFEGIG